MIKQIEKEIRDLQKALAEVQKGQAALCLQPCQGDSEIREKDKKLEELQGASQSGRPRTSAADSPLMLTFK